ncbi:hypothetical protein ACFL0E_00450 [Nanoarchaeota archaeon]
MSNLVTFTEKQVISKGLNQNNKIDENKLKEHFLADDYEKLKLLEKIQKINQPKEKPTIFYPGCGSDILTPLIYLEKLFPQTKEANLIFIDEVDFKGIIKTILDEIGVTFSEGIKKNKNKIKFYWKNTLINLEFIEENIFNLNLPEFDIYFEKAFRIMKDRNSDYEKNIINKLNKNGILISDSGFQNTKLKNLNAPTELSTYREMIIGVKEN